MNNNEDFFKLLADLAKGSELTPEQESAADRLEAMRQDLLQRAGQNDSLLFYFSTVGSKIDRKALIGREQFQDAVPYKPAQAAERAKFRSFYNRICRASKTDPLNVAERPPALGFFNYTDPLKLNVVYEGWIAISNERQLAEIEDMMAGYLWPDLAVLNQTSAGKTDHYLYKMSRFHRLYPDLFPDRSLIIK